MHKGIRSICIVGGGTAGWMAASLLSTVLSSNQIKITLVESPDIDTVGVGESTIPDIRDFLRACQIDIKTFVRETCATFKLGIRFEDWWQKGEHYFHPFGRVGQNVNGFDFYQVWLRSLEQGKNTPFIAHALCATMANHHKFTIPSQGSQDGLDQNFSYAFHLDATRFARYLRNLSVQRGVQRVEATVEKVALERDFITSLTLNDGTQLSSDFFIDCSGFKGLLIEESLKVGYDDWSEYLPCNRAVLVQTENTQAPRPSTIASAKDAGWMWNIPLQSRAGNGYVFASDYISDADALKTLSKGIKGKMVTEPRFIPFLTGKRKKIWHNNCLSLGLASGFIEPLESTAIHLIYKTLIHFITHFPDRDFEPTNSSMFNDKISNDYEEIRDFIVLHYCTTQRDDTAFWRWCKQMTLPETLKRKIQQFQQCAQLELSPNALFTRDSWWSVLEGMQVRPVKNHPLMQGFDLANLNRLMTNSVQQIENKVSGMPTHDAFIQANCSIKEAM